MYSPWQQNGQGTYSVPGLPAELLARNQANMQAFSNIGRFAGALGAGAVGAGQGAQDPGAFGDGTSPASGAGQGFLMNFNNASGGDGSGTDMNGFSRLVNGGNSGEGGSAGGIGNGVNFKQFEAMGKVADSMRDAVKATTPTQPDQQPVVLGMNDDQWKHAGTAAKVTALQGWKQAQDVKNTMAGYDAGQLHMQQIIQQNSDIAAQAKERDAEAQSTTDAGTVLQRYAQLAAPTQSVPGTNVGDEEDDQPTATPGMSSADAFNKAVSEMPPGMDVGRTMPKVMDAITKMNALKNGAKPGFFDANDLNKPLPDGYARVVTGPNASQVVAIPNATGPIEDQTGHYFFDGKKWMTAKGETVPPAAVLASYDKENAGLRAQLIYMSPDEKTAAQAQIADNETKAATLRSGSGAPASSGKRVSVTGPNGQTGTIIEGDKLPDGWQLK